MTSLNRFALMLAAAVLTVASSLPSEAQIGYPFPPYRYPNIHPDASVRVDVTPRDTKSIDGYYAGVVDDFDGLLQRLRVEPGRHEITLYHDGVRAVHQRIYLTRDRTFKLKQQLEKLPEGEVEEPRPIPAPLPASANHRCRCRAIAVEHHRMPRQTPPLSAMPAVLRHLRQLSREDSSFGFSPPTPMC